jgi:tRNA-(ms[2]io[6]A)-hydroxylase
VEPKRKLPIVRDSPAEPHEEPRPPWHWIGFGTVAIFGAWLPLAYFAELIGVRLAGGDLEAMTATARDRAKLGLALFAPHFIALLVATWLGGFLVGRYGGDKIGAREAALSGVAAAILACALARTGVSWVPVAVVAVAAGGALLGGRSGRKGRKAQ